MSLCGIAVALPCEAKPLIAYYQLKKDQAAHAFQCYRDETGDIFLIVTGIGKVAMAAGVAYLQRYSCFEKNTIYVNVGIGGSQEFFLGDMVVANKIRDVATQRCFYPNIALLKKQIFGQVDTHDTPQFQYPLQGVVDMEASAFFQTASLFSYQDLVHVVKIVSDTTLSEHQSISSNDVVKSVEKSIEKIDALIQELGHVLQKSENFFWDTMSFRQYGHFSVYQQHELRKILRRWRIVLSKKNPIECCEKARHPNDVLRILNDCLENATYEWGE